MNSLTRKDIADLILEKLVEQREQISSLYNSSKNEIGYFFVDDLLPDEVALKCFKVFPDKSDMRCLKSIREYKYVSAQMNKHHPLLEDVLYAFHDTRVVNLISEICNVKSVYADELLYAGGLSLMGYSNFLNPHLDNSHDFNRDRWRVFNLLYYVSPEWKLSNGGNLELWPNGPKKEPIEIESKFNRLVVMATHQKSWHSVNKVMINKNRCCISNYFFSDMPLRQNDKFHITKFRGRPNQTITNIILDTDAFLRMSIRKLFKKGIRKNPHVYKKKSSN